MSNQLKFFLLIILSAFLCLYPLVTDADTKIRILLLDEENPKIPQKGEEIEMISEVEGRVFLSNIKFKGIIRVWKGKNGLYIINEIPLEDYIKGVVVSEVGQRWDIEALKAQAIAARTFVLYHMVENANQKNKKIYDVTSSVLHQLYRDTTIPESIEIAVDLTKKEILTYDNKPIISYYHSTSVGLTEDPLEVFNKSYPYLKPVETICNLSPYCIWERNISIKDIENALNIKNIQDIEINSLTLSKRSRTLKILTSVNQEQIINTKDFRKNVGWDKIPSTMITNITKDDTNKSFIFSGKGYGHGVGMCQWSALEMAKEGKNYKEILSTFYPGTIIKPYNEVIGF